ncbi:type III-B CRISPR module RAMP protein Cmr1 [Moraxella cuniculi]|uniref:CRISPR type III-B/RAMP module RAMP protein Cmr1 n=1 Tax=Moraxella cuniculi TaxID=34061 RepID=A0A3S4SBC0_9GAMM|nr:type III-B CRISPR module RAMP protein Cmr1 [Moraxella cuniculi]VEG12225.1 CRISPR type III-B/RAMP module RAMP protein Cmr1 [Moraxella cuniculi]
MTVRIPKAEHDALLSEAKETLQAQSSVLQWHTLHCELITPMYGGGVISTKVDEKMPIRASAIRGQLRFWWRLLAKHQWNLEDIAKAEQKLWGGMGIGDADGQAGQVLLRVKNCSKPNIEAWARYLPNHKQKLILTPEKWANVPYALFPAQGKLRNKGTEIEENPHELLREGFTWELQVAFLPSIEQVKNELLKSEQPSFETQVWESIRWWSNFGGVGARTRRGLGAVQIQQNQFFTKIISKDEVERLGFCVQMKVVSSNSVYQSWEYAVKALEKFRQIGVGRNDHSSRSHWSEPDAIRAITGQSIAKHSQRKTKGDIFPRAGFGLPIITKFKDNNPKGDDTSKYVDPITTTLKLKYRKDANADWEVYERLSSPLILRPYLDEQNQWHSLVLVLNEPLYQSELFQPVLEVGKNNYRDVVFWNDAQATDIKPLKQGEGEEILKPLQAFLTYFAK